MVLASKTPSTHGAERFHLPLSKMTDFDKVFWAALGTWCVYQIVQAVRCAYYVMFEPWVLEQDEDDETPT